MGNLPGFRYYPSGAAAAQCGNYFDMNLPMAKYHARKYLREVFETPDKARLNDPG